MPSSAPVVASKAWMRPSPKLPTSSAFPKFPNPAGGTIPQEFRSPFETVLVQVRSSQHVDESTARAVSVVFGIRILFSVTDVQLAACSIPNGAYPRNIRVDEHSKPPDPRVTSGTDR